MQLHQLNIFDDGADLSGIAGKPNELKVDRLFTGTRFKLFEGKILFARSFRRNIIFDFIPTPASVKPQKVINVFYIFAIKLYICRIL